MHRCVTDQTRIRTCAALQGVTGTNVVNVAAKTRTLRVGSDTRHVAALARAAPASAAPRAARTTEPLGSIGTASTTCIGAASRARVFAGHPANGRFGSACASGSPSAATAFVRAIGTGTTAQREQK
jgi:hypothetical protein